MTEPKFDEAASRRKWEGYRKTRTLHRMPLSCLEDSLDAVIKILQDTRSEYGEGCSLEFDLSFDDDCGSYVEIERRDVPLSPSEVDGRVTADRKYFESCVERNRAEYARLKKVFEPEPRGIGSTPVLPGEDKNPFKAAGVEPTERGKGP